MRINLYAGPGSGKSTTAAWIFNQLKQRHYNTELITEYVKEWAWQKRTISSWDQFYIFAKQLYKEDCILRNKNTIVVTDSPLLMILSYMRSNGAPTDYMYNCWDLVTTFDEQYPTINIVLERSVPYAQNGRYETEEQAAIMDKLISEYVTAHYIDNYITFNPISGDYSKLLKYILERLDNGRHESMLDTEKQVPKQEVENTITEVASI